MATISQLEAQQRQLMSELNRYRKEADERIRANEARYSRAYEELKAKSRSVIEEDREKTRKRYVELLEYTEAEVNDKLNAMIEETKRRYDEVKQELDAQIAEEKANLKEAISEQNRVSMEYRENIQKQKQYAEEAIRETREDVEHFLDIYPVKWFLPNREEIYRGMLSRLYELYESGVYQAVTGLSDDLKMRIGMDKAQIERDIDKWFRYFSVLKSIIDGEHTLIHTDSKDLGKEDLSEAFFSEENISDRTLTAEMFTKWVDPAYSALIDDHKIDYDFLQRFLGNVDFYGEGIPASETIMKCMKESLKQSDSYSTEILYDRAKSALDRTDKESTYVRVMRSRLKAFDLRCEMFNILCDRMDKLGYDCIKSYYSVENDEREAAVAVFEDFGQVTRIEVQFVPVLSIVENKWYNGIGYSIISDADIYDIEQKVDMLLHDEFDVYGVGILPIDRRRNRYSSLERTSNYSNSLRIMINGHA